MELDLVAKNGKSFREYHIDTHDILMDHVTPAGKVYYGDLSVRRNKSKRPLMLIGQDESTYHQYVFSNKGWKGPTGAVPLLPKSSGEILMINTMMEDGLINTMMKDEITSARGSDLELKTFEEAWFHPNPEIR